MTDPSAKMLTTAGRGGTMLLNLIRQCADILSIAFLGIRRDSVVDAGICGAGSAMGISAQT